MSTKRDTSASALAGPRGPARGVPRAGRETRAAAHRALSSAPRRQTQRWSDGTSKTSASLAYATLSAPPPARRAAAAAAAAAAAPPPPLLSGGAEAGLESFVTLELRGGESTGALPGHAAGAEEDVCSVAVAPVAMNLAARPALRLATFALQALEPLGPADASWAAAGGEADDDAAAAAAAGGGSAGEGADAAATPVWRRQLAYVLLRGAGQACPQSPCRFGCRGRCGLLASAAAPPSPVARPSGTRTESALFD